MLAALAKMSHALRRIGMTWTIIGGCSPALATASENVFARIRAVTLGDEGIGERRGELVVGARVDEMQAAEGALVDAERHQLAHQPNWRRGCGAWG